MRVMKALGRAVVVAAGVVALWQVLVWATKPLPFILPGPARVAGVWLAQHALILRHTGTTSIEIVAGLLAGTAFGVAAALTLAYFRPARRWLLPVLVASQAVPVFALAPILVLWLGYGLASKVAMAALIIFFPVTASFYDGLRRTDPGWLELARTMNADRWRLLRHVRLPSALPALASGLRVAAAVAPIGAVIGEWVGSSSGLGYLMLQANARMQVDLMFAALATLAAVSLLLYYLVDAGARRLLPWSPDSTPSDD
jgi:putative hydroxymethylpyrimidine transport system permease protein